MLLTTSSIVCTFSASTFARKCKYVAPLVALTAKPVSLDPHIHPLVANDLSALFRMADHQHHAGAGTRHDPMEIDASPDVADGLNTPPPKSSKMDDTSAPATPTPQQRTPGAGSSAAKSSQKESKAAVMVDTGIQTSPSPIVDQSTMTEDRDLVAADQEADKSDSAGTGETDDEEDEGGPCSKRKVLQKTRKAPKETFEPHPTDPTKIKATFRVKKPDKSGDYVQVHIIPEIVKTAKSATDGSSYFIPPLDVSKVPNKVRQRKDRPSPGWVKEDNGDSWSRTYTDKGVSKHEVFTPIILFRRFNSVTHEYEGAHVSEKKLKNLDPNNRRWTYSYNKWIDQIRRRRAGDYVKTLPRDHWTPAEMRAFYIETNRICHVKGKHIFGVHKECGMTSADYQAIADAVNVVGGHNRNIDAVRGKILAAHAKKDVPLFELRGEAAAMRELIEDGGIMSRAEQYPVHAIPLSDFPADVDPKTKKRKKAAKKAVAEGGTDEGAEEQRADDWAAQIPEDDDSDLSSAPSDLDTVSTPKRNKKGKGKAPASVGSPTQHRGQSSPAWRSSPEEDNDESEHESEPDEDSSPSPASSPRKRKRKRSASASASDNLTDDDGLYQELAAGEDGNIEESQPAETPSPPAKKARLAEDAFADMQAYLDTKRK
jgi:hypothetical protein